MDRQLGRQGCSLYGWPRRVVVSMLVLAAALLLTAAPAASQRPAPPRPLAAAKTTPYRQGVVLVGFRSGVSAARRSADERSAGAASARRLGPAVAAVGRGRVTTQEFLSPFVLHVPAGQELATIERLRHDPAVAYAEPNYILSASATPNDPSFSVQWGDSNAGQEITSQEINEQLGAPAAGTPGADDRALSAWGVSTGSRSIVVAETDTGVDYTHPDLAANIWSNPGKVGGCEKGTHGYNVVAKSCNPLDEDPTYNGHGTHVAGIIGALGNNEVGVAGMNWQTTILPVKWMNQAAYGETSSLIEAMQWIVAAKQAGVNIRVVNNSDTFFGTAYSQALSNAIDVLGANNILFVASAGNTGNNDDEVVVQRYPCSYDRANEICVAATNNNDQLPNWANYGPHTVDLAAPGVSIYSTLRGGTYGYLSGSSMAAPQVSGAAALILSVAPTLSAAALKADILENVDRLPSLTGKVITGGRLNVCKALPGCAGAAAKAPANSRPPTISGSPQVGQTLTAVRGAWTNRPTSFAYQWLRCTSSGGSCATIANARSQTYVLEAADLGRTIRVQETASNWGGTTAARSAATATVVAGPPVNSSAPRISGQPNSGQYLYASAGSWSEHPSSYAYQWLRCDSQGANCAPIAGATNWFYMLVEADAGSTVRVVVTASNSAGSSAPATSGRTSVVKVPKAKRRPELEEAPGIFGQASVGATLYSYVGQWTENPTSYAYQWQRCDSQGGKCAAIGGATSYTYTLAEGDAGKTLRVVVTASNAAGSSAPATSSQTSVVTWPQVANTAPPTISGIAQTGQTLSATSGTWSGSPTGYTYQWQRCDGSGANCAPIAPATSSSYVIAEGDVGSTLRVVVTASNASGHPQLAASETTEVVVGAVSPPVNTYAPVITGSNRVGQTLTEAHGGWTNEPTSFAYQWLRCDEAGSNCQPIPGATEQTYTTVTSDLAHAIAVAETASNVGGSGGPAYAAPTVPIVPSRPTNTAAPSISGTPQQGQTLTAVHGTWTNEPTSYGYQWLRCDEAGANCVPIGGATSQAFVPASADVGHTIVVKETAINAGGPSIAAATSTPTALVAAGSTATFGNTNVGPLVDGGMYANYKVVHHAVFSGSGAVANLELYAVPGVASGPEALKAVIYADAGGVPGALVATGVEATYRGNVNGSGWFELPFAAPVHLSAGTYWIGFITGGTSSGVGYAYEEVPGSRAYSANPFASGPSDPFGPATVDSEQASIYATYVPGP
jgi:subtilisin family serine protease